MSFWKGGKQRCKKKDSSLSAPVFSKLHTPQLGELESPLTRALSMNEHRESEGKLHLWVRNTTVGINRGYRKANYFGAPHRLEGKNKKYDERINRQEQHAAEMGYHTTN